MGAIQRRPLFVVDVAHASPAQVSARLSVRRLLDLCAERAQHRPKPCARAKLHHADQFCQMYNYMQYRKLINLELVAGIIAVVALYLASI